ncbi:MAG: glutamyl-tRNA reductase, partial [Clostridium sp.]
MNISMVGIDHNIADVNIREKVALTKTKLTLVLRKIKDFYCVSGVVIISTCNRTEIWLNGYDDKASLEDMVCNVLNVNREFVKLYFVKRIGEDAVRHLFSLSSGVESKIIGEDQILTQVRQSADIAREN